MIKKKDKIIPSHQLSDVSNLARNAGYTNLGEIAAVLVNFLFVVVITRVAGASVYGIFLLAQGIITILFTLCLCGLSNGIVRYVSFYRAKEDPSRIKGTIIFALLFVLSLCLFFSMLTFFAADIIATNVFHESQVSLAIRILVFSAPFLVITSILTSAIHGFQAIRELVLIQHILKPAIKLLFLVSLFLIGLRLMGILLSVVLSSVILVIISYGTIKKIFPFMDRSIHAVFQPKELISFSWPILLSNFLYQALHWTDIMMLGFFLDSREVGIYGVVIKVGPFIALPLNAFNTVFSPLISELHTKGETGKLERDFKLITKWVFTFSFPVFIFLVLFPGHILGIFGTGFAAGTIPLFLICLGELINTAAGASGLMVIMTGRSKIDLLNAGLSGSLNVVLNYLLIPRYGMTGAALATSTTMILLNALRVMEVYYLLGVHPYSFKMLKPLGSGLLSLAVFLLIRDRFLGIIEFARYGILIPATFFVLLYITVLFLFRFDFEDRFILKKIAQKLR